MAKFYGEKNVEQAKGIVRKHKKLIYEDDGATRMEEILQMEMPDFKGNLSDFVEYMFLFIVVTKIKF